MAQKGGFQAYCMLKLVSIRLPEHSFIKRRVNGEAFGFEEGLDQNVNVLIGVEGDHFAGGLPMPSGTLFFSINDSISP